MLKLRYNGIFCPSVKYRYRKQHCTKIIVIFWLSLFVYFIIFGMFAWFPWQTDIFGNLTKFYRSKINVFINRNVLSLIIVIANIITLDSNFIFKYWRTMSQLSDLFALFTVPDTQGSTHPGRRGNPLLVWAKTKDTRKLESRNRSWRVRRLGRICCLLQTSLTSSWKNIRTRYTGCCSSPVTVS